MVHRPESPPVEDDGVTVLQEQVLELLEAANIPQHICDEVMSTIARGEYLREEGIK